MSQGYEAMGMSAMARKKYDDAVAQFKLSVENASEPAASVTSKVRMAAALNLSGKYDEAIAVVDPLLKETDINPAVRQFAAQEKVKAVTAKMKK